MKTKILILLIFSLIHNFTYSQEKHRESILDKVSHIEDTVYYNIDSVEMLCKELNMDGKLVDIEGCRLYCEIAGEGVPIVLVNGGPGGTHQMFHPWFKDLEKFSKVIYYDQRGCGQSDFIKGNGYSFRQAVDDLEKLRIQLGFKKWIICGFSYGGALAQYYMTLYPESVMGTILVGAGPLLLQDELEPTRQFEFISQEEKDKMREIGQLYKKGKIDINTLIYNRFLNGDWKRQFFYKPTKEEMARIALYEWVNDANFNAKVGADYSRRNFKGVFNNNPIPTLICEGLWDLTWSAEKKQLLKNNHPNAEMIVFEKSAHNIYNEETELFFTTIEKFIKNLKPVPNKDINKWKEEINTFLVSQNELENIKTDE